ncbi:MAG TPA: NAD(P)-binding domain-containing protein [Planctomycetota bacterium]|nr:NAD(P)-binding domain-containing protein [Planctomycetota bacterium]
MKVGILGTGDVGKALGRGCLALGHSVMMGARDAANPKAAGWVQEMGTRASVGTFAQAARSGDLVFLATLGSVTEEILRSVGADAFRGKLVIDATNPLDFSKGAPRLIGTVGDSAGERHQKLLPGAHVVKAFNTVGNAYMFKPEFPGGPPDMFLCGDDDGAKSKAAALCRDFGWGVIDVGGIESSHFLEAMCMVWVLSAMKTGTWSQAFKMLKA